MNLVIQVPCKAKDPYIIMLKQNGLITYYGEKCNTKAEAIEYCREEIYDRGYIDETVIIWDDSQQAYDTGSTYTTKTLKPKRKNIQLAA